MDIKIENGDTIISESGIPEMVSGIEEAIQKVNLAIKIRKGKFIYDRNIGTQIDSVIFEDKNASETVEMMLNECLIDTCVSVKVNYIETRQNKTYAGITVTNGFISQDTEVILNG